MGLKGFKIATETINVPSSEGFTPLEVRGISAGEVAALLRAHGPLLQALYRQALEGTLDLTDAESVTLALIDVSPELLARIIALALDDADEWQVAARLPIMAQVELVDAIARLSFSSEGGLGKFLEIVIRLWSMGSMTPSPHPSA